MDLKIIVAENGFIISEHEAPNFVGKMWAFESPESLARYIQAWGDRNMRTRVPELEANKPKGGHPCTEKP